MTEKDDNKPAEKEAASDAIDIEYVNNEENVREEYNLLDSKLDDLNTALDVLEQKNDDIHKQLKELLQSNRDVREQLKQEQCASNNHKNN